jgi:hypothetical protein
MEQRRDPTGPSQTAIKRLFAHSGNRCAFPQCSVAVVQGDTVVGEICHIKAANPSGPRYDPQQTAAERHAYSNLILLCANHHKIIDSRANAEIYTVGHLAKMKTEHEGRATPIADVQVVERGARLLHDQLPPPYILSQASLRLERAIREAVRPPPTRPGNRRSPRLLLDNYLNLATVQGLLTSDETPFVRRLREMSNIAARSLDLTIMTTDALRYQDIANALIEKIKERSAGTLLSGA